MTLEAPYWWDDAPPSTQDASLPERVDALVIGAGYTGLSAARTFAERGWRVAAIDAGEPGAGASARAGGMLGDVVKPGFSALTARHGEAAAIAMWQEARDALQHAKTLIQAEALDCDFAETGRFTGAMRPDDYEAMGRDLDRLRRHFDVPGEMVPRSEQQREIKTELFHGGRIFAHHGAVHSGKFLAELRRVTEEKGATVVGGVRATAINTASDGFAISTSGGTIHARKVVVATNAYTGRVAGRLRRMVVPVHSHMIATEPLGENRVISLFPTGRMVTDTLKVASYFRPSPDGTRVLYGGRAGSSEGGLARAAGVLQRRLLRVFPELQGTAISHVWTGRVAFSFVPTPQIGSWKGLHYAFGYSGSGLAMANWLGRKAALQALQDPAGASAFDAHRSPAPLGASVRHLGVRAAIAAYNVADARGWTRTGAG